MRKSNKTKRTKNNTSAFATWFEEQAGKDPCRTEADYLKLRHETVPALRQQLAAAEQQLREADDYRLKKQFALYAWMARPKEPTSGTNKPTA